MIDKDSELPLYRFFIVVNDKVVCFECNDPLGYHDLLWSKKRPYIVFFRIPEDNDNSDWRKSATGYDVDKVAILMSKSFDPIPDPLIMIKIRSGEV